LTFGQGRQREDILLKKFELFDVLNRPFLRQRLAGRGQYELTSEAITRLKAAERAAIANNHPINFLFSPVGALSRAYRHMHFACVVCFVFLCAWGLSGTS